MFSGDGYLKANIDDFRIYNRTLTASEVSNLYRGQVRLYAVNRVGIGTTTPSFDLDVNGNINFNGSLYRNGVLSPYYTPTETSNIFTTSNVLLATSNDLRNYTDFTSNRLYSFTQTGTSVDLTPYFTKTETSNIFTTNSVFYNTSNYLINYDNLINKPLTASQWTTINASRIYYGGTTIGIGKSALSDAYQLDVYGRIRSDYNFDGFSGFTAYNLSLIHI